MSYVVESLSPNHERGAFCCGNEIIDGFWLRALSEHERYKVRIHIIRSVNDNVVLGFYSLCLSTIEKKTITGLRKFGERPIPAVYLAMIAVDENYQHQGLGVQLMAHAFEAVYTISQKAGVYCLWLDAVDDQKAQFYARLGFEPLDEGKLQMFLPVMTIVDLVSNNT